MQKILLSLVLLGALSMRAQGVEYTAADSALVVRLLGDAPAERGDENRMLYFGKKFIGKPYVANTLEGGTSEHLIVNLREMDCTTFVETVLALALCDRDNARTFDDFCSNLALVRYRDGQLGDYTSRLHYFSWWADDNVRKGILSTVDGPAFSGVQKVNLSFMSTHPDSYRQLKLHPEFVPVIRNLETRGNGATLRYIPKADLRGSRRSKLGDVCSGDILALTTTIPGLDVTHLGIALWQDGKLHLLNASSLAGKVILDPKPLHTYQQSQRRQTGVAALRLRD
ncbi:MAG: DUF1460 domain-containing protein [Muribaculaceae bacterium]|nr:DUF1460 domain-containing protein [Muribaculaceae bacterium]